MGVLAQNTQYQRVIGRAGNENSYAIKPTPDGGFILVGSTDSASNKDVLLTKVDGLGQVQWFRSYDVYGGDDIGWGIAVASDSGYVIAGQTYNSNNGSNDALIFKTKKDGSVDWTLTYADSFNSDAYNVLAGRNGEFYITGYTQTDTMGDNIFVSRVSGTGGISWYRTFGTEANEEGYALAQDLQGDIIVVGITNSDSITAGGKGGNPGDVDMVVGKLRGVGGSLVWMYNYGTVERDIAWDVAITQAEYGIAGWTAGANSSAGDNDATFTTIDSNGSVTRSLSYGTFGDDRAFSLSVIPGGYLMGGYSDPSGQDRNVMTLKLSSNGFLTDFGTIGTNTGTDGHWPTDVSLSTDGGVMAFSSTDSYRSGQGTDLYLIRSDAKLANACNSPFDIIGQGTVTYSRDTITYQSVNAPIARPSITANSDIGIKDTTLCCKLEARIIADSVQTCGPVGTSIGRTRVSGYIYNWTEVNSSWTSTSANPFVTPTTTTTYKLVVSSTDGACAPDSATVKVVVKPLLTGDFVTDSFFCENDSVSISTRGDLASYSWVGQHVSGNSSSLVVKKADTIILSVSDNNGCSYKDTARVVMMELPRFSLGNDTSICVNLAITLMGPDNMISYDWNNGESSSQTFVTSEEQVNVLEVVDSFGCKWSDDISILTNPYSEFSLGPDTAFCEGTTWSILGPGALNGYIWNDTASTLQNLPITEPGTYHLTAFNSFGCPFSDTVTLTERPAPSFTLSDNENLCDGESRTLRGPAGYDFYQWQDQSTTDSFVANNAGTYILTIRDEFDCPFTDTLVLIARANPVVFLGNDTTIIYGDTLTLDAGAGYTEYDWSTGATSQTIDVKEKGTYSVVVTNQYGCTGGDAIVVDTIMLSVRDLLLKGVKVYPVPASDYVMLDLGDVKNGDIVIELFDMNGKIIYREEATAGESSIRKIDLSGTTPGIHMIRLYNSQGSATLKLLVE